MSIIDVAIPGIIGVVLCLWPQSMFIGSKLVHGPKEIRVLRIMGVVLVLMAGLFLLGKLASS